jgi:hypothetical protein
MALVKSYDEAKVVQNRRVKTDTGGSTGVSLTTPFFGSRDQADLPHAVLAQWDPGRLSRTHFHVNDQFQVVVAGKGKLGRHELAPYSVHFSRAYTPYGPLTTADGSSLSFFVMRPHYDPASQRLPKEMQQLNAVPNRRPWQITSKADFPEQELAANASDVLLESLPGMRDEQGLAGYALSVKANADCNAPDSSRSGGQYLVIVKGSLLYQNKEYPALSLVFVHPHEGSFKIRAGNAGLAALILNFPRPRA